MVEEQIFVQQFVDAMRDSGTWQGSYTKLGTMDTVTLRNDNSPLRRPDCMHVYNYNPVLKVLYSCRMLSFSTGSQMELMEQ